MCHPSSTIPDSRGRCSSVAGLSGVPSIGSQSTGCKKSRSAPRAHSPNVCARHVALAGSGPPRSPIRRRSDRSDNEGYCGPRLRGVRASTSRALQRIKRPTMNHIRFIRLKNFSDRLLGNVLNPRSRPDLGPAIVVFIYTDAFATGYTLKKPRSDNFRSWIFKALYVVQNAMIDLLDEGKD